MSRRGYFEKQNGKYRLRIVEPGYDADDPNVPGNKVIIDSDNFGTLSILKSGIYRANNINQVNGRWIESGWNLPYVPLCSFLFNTNNQPYWGRVLAGSAETQLRVTNDGIYINLRDEVSSNAFPLRIRWVAFRLPVTP